MLFPHTLTAEDWIHRVTDTLMCVLVPAHLKPGSSLQAFAKKKKSQIEQISLCQGLAGLPRMGTFKLHLPTKNVPFVMSQVEASLPNSRRSTNGLPLAERLKGFCWTL